MSDSNVFDQKSEKNMAVLNVTLTVNAQDFLELSSSLIEKRIYFKVTPQGFPSVDTAGLLMPKREEVLLPAMSQKAIFEHIYHRYMIDEIVHFPPKIEVIAKDLRISPSKFKALFRQFFGLPFYTCYLQRKMEYACRLLKSGFTASQVSAEIGYSHPIKFNKMFQKYMGVTPKQYQTHYFSVPDEIPPILSFLTMESKHSVMQTK